MYRKKSLTWAKQWTGENTEELVDLFGELFSAGPDGTAVIYDKLHDVDIPLSLGDWVARGPKGELYPIRDEVFRETYEQA